MPSCEAIRSVSRLSAAMPKAASDAIARLVCSSIFDRIGRSEAIDWSLAGRTTAVRVSVTQSRTAAANSSGLCPKSGKKVVARAQRDQKAGGLGPPVGSRHSASVSRSPALPKERAASNVCFAPASSSRTSATARGSGELIGANGPRLPWCKARSALADNHRAFCPSRSLFFAEDDVPAPSLSQVVVIKVRV